MLIGLIGNKGSGKDTLAEYIKTKLNIETYAFAYKLKLICQILFELNNEQLHGNLKETIIDSIGVSPRNIFQKIGTDLFRKQLPNVFPELNNYLNNDSIWIKSFELWYQKNKHKNVIVTDVRFQNEADAITRNGGILIKIVRNNKKNDSHESEQNINHIKHTFLLQNFGSLKDFYQKIDNLFDVLKLLN